jgi:hypothetical protein
MNESAGDPVQVLDKILTWIADPIIRQAGLYWRGKIKAGRLPARSDIDPLEIPALLPHIVLWNVEHSPLRFRGRLVGSHIVEMSGRDATGRYVDFVDDHGVVEAEYRAVAASGLPRYQERRAHWPNHDHKYYARLLLPLAQDGRQVDMLFGAINTLASLSGER